MSDSDLHSGLAGKSASVSGASKYDSTPQLISRLKAILAEIMPELLEDFDDPPSGSLSDKVQPSFSVVGMPRNHNALAVYVDKGYVENDNGDGYGWTKSAVVHGAIVAQKTDDEVREGLQAMFQRRDARKVLICQEDNPEALPWDELANHTM